MKTQTKLPLRQRLAYFTIATATVVLSACSPAMSNASPAGSGDYAYASSAPAAEAPAAAAPAGQQFGMGEAAVGMYFENYGVNGFVDTAQDNLSTFGVDVDTGAYTLARSYINDNVMPPQDAVRVEEFVNFFDYHYQLPKAEQTFAIDMQGARSPFSDDPNSRLLRVGIQGYDIAAEDRKDAALTFVIDVSGSMSMDNRLGLVKRSLTKMVEELRPTDSVGIVVYGSTAWTVLSPTPLSEKQTVLDAIERIQSEGSTNAAEGIALGYQLAWKNFREGALNRVILCSDGVANVGITEPGGILDTVKQYAAKGIYMTSVGVGMGNYNDVLMEQLADGGDGFYAYVDSDKQADKLFLHDLVGTLQTIAKDAKIQVEFNPETVARYRLVGYENRDVADNDFRNDQVDAGEVGAGHSVTALYEVDLTDAAAQRSDAAIATVHLRWLHPESEEASEISQTLSSEALAATVEAANPYTRLAIISAQFAELLRGSQYGEGYDLGTLSDDLQTLRDQLSANQMLDPEVSEFVDLVWKANQLAGSTVQQ